MESTIYTNFRLLKFWFLLLSCLFFSYTVITNNFQSLSFYPYLLILDFLIDTILRTFPHTHAYIYIYIYAHTRRRERSWEWYLKGKRDFITFTFFYSHFCLIIFSLSFYLSNTLDHTQVRACVLEHAYNYAHVSLRYEAYFLIGTIYSSFSRQALPPTQNTDPPTHKHSFYRSIYHLIQKICYFFVHRLCLR